jgi:hypothetical protein
MIHKPIYSCGFKSFSPYPLPSSRAGTPPAGPLLFPCCFWGFLPSALCTHVCWRRPSNKGWVCPPPWGRGARLCRGGTSPHPPPRPRPLPPQDWEGTSFSKNKAQPSQAPSQEASPCPQGARPRAPKVGALGSSMSLGVRGQASEEGAQPLQPSLHPVIYSEGFKS